MPLYDYGTARSLFDRGAIGEDTFRQMYPTDPDQPAPLDEAFVPASEPVQLDVPTEPAPAPPGPSLTDRFLQGAAAGPRPDKALAPGVQPAQPSAPIQTADMAPEDVGQVVLASDGTPMQSAAPNAPAMDPLAGLQGDLLRGYNIQQAAIREASKVGEAKAAEQAAHYDRIQREDMQRLEQNQAAEAARQTKLDAKSKELDDAATELGTLKVDPDRYWANKGTGDKVMAGIGMFLGAFSGTGSNTAVDAINKAIDRDIAVQKANIENQKDAYSAKKGVYADMVSRFRDKSAAEAATKLAYLQNAEISVRQMEAKFAGPEMKAKAAALIGEIETKKADAKMQFMGRMAKLNGGSAPDPVMDAILKRVPKEQQNKAIEEKGQADGWNALTSDVMSTYKRAMGVGASGVIPSIIGGSKESYQAAKAKIAGVLVGKIPGLKSNVDFEEVIVPMLPRVGESSSEAKTKMANFQAFMKANAPQTPLLDGFGLKPVPLEQRVQFSTAKK